MKGKIVINTTIQPTMVPAPNHPPRSPRRDEIIKERREPPPLKRKTGGTSLSEANLETLAALGSRLQRDLALAGTDHSLNPPATRR